MYISHFHREEDLNKIADFVREHDFATLVLAENNVPIASHLLVDFQTDTDGTWLLSGHMARANPLWQKFDSEREVLLMFGGPNTYISPTWYNHLNVPTWNYIAVHLYGFPRVIDGGDELRNILARLIQRYETNSDYRMEISALRFCRETDARRNGFSGQSNARGSQFQAKPESRR